MANEVRPCEFPRRLLVPFPRGKGTRPAGRNPLRRSRRHSMIVPSSGPFGATFPIPSVASRHLPTPFGLRPFPPDRGNRPLDKGSRPPGGRLRKNKKGQVLDLSLKTQRRNAVSQKVLLPTFLSRKVGGRNFSQKLPCFSPLLSNLIRKCKFSFRRLDTAPLGEYHRNDTNLRQNTGRRGIFTPGARGGLPCGEDF